MTSGLPEPVRGEVAIPGHFARRTAELARQPGPVVRWQRAVWGRPYVYPDDTVEAAVRDDADRWRPERLDASSGRALPGPWGPLQRHVLAEAAQSRAYRGLTVSATIEVGDTVMVSAADHRTGLSAWLHAPVPRDDFQAGPWCAWLDAGRPDADLLIPHDSGASRRLTLLDPLTGQVKWDVDWSHHVWARRGTLTGSSRRRADDGWRVRLAPTYLDSTPPGEPPTGLAGVGKADGTLLWHIDGLRADGMRWKHPAYLGSSGRYLVIAGVPGPEDGHAHTTIAIHDRPTGRPLWHARWPDRTAPHTPAAGVADIRGDIVLTREGDFIRARRVEDGSQLWATVPPPRYGLVRQDSAPGSQWAWLRAPEDDPSPGVPEGGSVTEGGDLFIHAPTGQQLSISDAFHQTRDGLVLTCADDLLTCLELPHQPAVD
jgi:hypothetical protein